MKKAYTKPEFLFESFELNRTIAAGCEVIKSFADKVCGVWDGESDYIFVDDHNCTRFPPNPDDAVCYDVPQESWNVYTS